MLRNLPEESSKLIAKIGCLAEAFITNVKRGRLDAARSGEESLSTAAAMEMTDIMATIVRTFQEIETERGSTTVQLLQANFPAAEVVDNQLRRLLLIVARTGDALLRGQFATLFLMNVTRRVLFILRDAAAANKGTEAELEEEAKCLLNHLASEDDEEAEEEAEADRTPEGGRRGGSRPGKGSSSDTGEDRDDDDDDDGRGGRRGGRSGTLQRGMRAAGSALRDMSSNQKQRRQLGVHFVHEAQTPPPPTAGTPSMPHSGSAMGDFSSPLIRRTYSIVATEIPGRQVLKRAPSKREQSLDAEGFIEFPVKLRQFYQDALDAIDELKRELEGMTGELCCRAPRQLHSSDTVITLGCSHTIRRYLLQAAKAGHQFKVVVLEGAPQPAEATQELAAVLMDNGISVQTLPDSSAFAVMSVCTKVLVGAENILANGGMLAAIGTHVLCAAARHFAVPVLVATTTLKMSPYYPSDQLCTRLVRIARTGAQEMPWSTYGSPEDVLPTPFGVEVQDSGRGFSVHAPVMEYVPPELITLFVTNESELVPSQIHRIVRSNYSDVD